MEKQDNKFKRIDSIFKREYGCDPKRHFVSYGRLEIIGNHTDHQKGHCLVGTCSQGIKGALNERDDNIINFYSDGYGSFQVDTNDIEMKAQERFRPISLVKGVLKGCKNFGYKIGGFDTAIISDIYKGAGVSSSAAFELYVAEVINVLYNDGKISKIEKAKIGQYAENFYFGKASGLLDQCGSSFGGVCYLDFTDLANVKVIPLEWPKWDISIFIVNPGSSHAGLSDLYSEMPNDMKEVASRVFQKEVLSEVPLDEFYKKIHVVDIEERKRLRALHFVGEDQRVLRAKRAIEKVNMDWFLELEKEAQLSQMSLLHNVMVRRNYSSSPLEAVERASLFLKHGSARVMGGGLAGSIICFVPSEEYHAFIDGMSAFYGKRNVLRVTIPENGAHEE